MDTVRRLQHERPQASRIASHERPRLERIPPGPENVCPEGQAQFGSFAGGFAARFDAGDGPMGVDP